MQTCIISLANVCIYYLVSIFFVNRFGRKGKYILDLSIFFDKFFFPVWFFATPLNLENAEVLNPTLSTTNRKEMKKATKDDVPLLMFQM
jgi:hypothetical protein